MSPLASFRSSKATVLWIGTQRKQFNVGAYVAETYRSRFAWITGLLCWLLVSVSTATAHVSPEHRKPDERYARVTLNWVCGSHAPRQSPILCEMTDADCDKRCPEAPPGCGRTLKVQVQSSSDRVIGI